jgi:glucan biosynthesis protein
MPNEVGRMRFEPEVSVITGKVTHVGGKYIYVWPGTRITLQPDMDSGAFSVGMRMTVRAVRRHGHFIAEKITPELTDLAI